MKFLSLKHEQRGVGLIEILMAILILALGVLGFMSLQLRALEGSDDAFYRAQAMLIASDIASHMTVNSQRKMFFNAERAAEDVDADKKARKKILNEYIDSDNWGKTAVVGDFINNNGCDGNNVEVCPENLAKWDISVSSINAQKLLPEGEIWVAEIGSAERYRIYVTWGGVKKNAALDSDGNCKKASSISKCVQLEVVL